MKKLDRMISLLLALLLCLGLLPGTALAAPPAAPPGGSSPGGSPPGGGSSVSYSGATTLTSGTTAKDKTYASTTAEQNALLVSGGSSTLTDAVVTKSGSPASGGDNYDFYGSNAAVLVYNDASLTLQGGSVTTDASYGNGLFAYGTGKITATGVTITTSGRNSGAFMVTGGGTLTATDCTAVTSGNSAAPIRSDRGGGTLTVTGGTYTSKGVGSPVIYCTADITVKNATLTAQKSEGVVVEGKNSVSLSGVTLTDTNNTLNGQSTTYKNIFLYQSMSGDASQGTASFSAENSKITTNKGDTIYVTNTSATVTLKNNTIVNNDSTGCFLRAKADSWGSSGSNGGTVTATLAKQTVSGDVYADSVSSVALSLTEGSALTGTINGANTAKSMKLTLDASSRLILTGDSYVTSFTDADASYGNIDFNGHKLYVNGKALTASSGGSSDGDSSESASVLTAPKLKSAKNVSTGVKVTWTKVTGASKYQVLRKVPGGSWKKLGVVTGVTYTDKTAKSGKTYVYTVRAVSAAGKNGAYNTTGKTVTYIAVPKLKSAKNVSTGVKVTWAKVSGAARYRVFRKVPGGSWKKLGTTAGTSYIDKTAKSGKTYLYTVRCVSASGKTYTSGTNPSYKKIVVS